ncbi:hypothetical protein [Thermogemmatispora sp.]|uniref:hypothetical protein n=1 Tax=Thermogemmatispora sp. TaxID=1968838 RepID=UPI0035E44687
MQQGFQQALQEGREDFTAAVSSRRPQLEQLVSTFAPHIHSLRTIRQLLLAIGQASNLEQSRALPLS